MTFTKEAKRAIQNYGWPGNVRELENSIERAVVLTESSEIREEFLALDNKKIEDAFERFVSAQNAVSHVITHKRMRDHISMRDLLRIAKGPKNDADHTLLLRVNDDFMARRQLRAILQSQSLASQPQQAAAASTREDVIQWRSGSAFDLNLIASSKNDGLFYLQLRLKDNEDMARLSTA